MTSYATASSPGRRIVRAESAAGFALIELMIAVVVGLVILTGIYQMMISQNRLYGVQRAENEVRETLRSSLSLLAWQIREIGPGEGDLYAIAANSITLRSIEGSAVVCSTQSASGSKRLGLQDASGYFQSTIDDSAMVWGTSDAQWHRFDVSQSWNTPTGAWSGAGLSVCFWGDSTTAYPRPQAALEVQGRRPIWRRPTLAASCVRIDALSTVEIVRRLEIFVEDVPVDILKQVDPKLQQMAPELSYAFQVSLAELGRGLHLLPLPNLDARGKPILSGAKAGVLRVRYRAEADKPPVEFWWHAPLTSVVGPKKCPGSGAPMQASWKFCRWNGKPAK